MANCDGCGKAFEQHRGYNNRKRDVCAKIKIGEHTKVCGSSRSNRYYSADSYTFGPQMSCLRKAFEKANACPGCGETDGQHTYRCRSPFSGLCSTCAEQLARANTMLTDELENYSLDETLVTSFYVDGARELLDALTRIAAATGPRRRGQRFGSCLYDSKDRFKRATGGMPSIEMDNGQKEALLEVAGLVKKLVDTAYLKGRRAGRDVLGNLADGTYSIEEFMDRQSRQAEEEDDDA